MGVGQGSRRDGQRFEHLDEIDRVPLAGHVGLAEADLAPLSQPGKESIGIVHVHHRTIGPDQNDLPSGNSTRIPVCVATRRRNTRASAARTGADFGGANAGHRCKSATAMP